ncbi:unnamed protein product [Heterobilharzia americana]|nr:unnamed protein product [Heterobilharzia americana]
MIGIPFICLDIIWEFAVWAVALMLYITSTALGTILRKDIFHYMVFWIVYYIVTFAVAITFGLLVHFKIIKVSSYIKYCRKCLNFSHADKIFPQK